MPTILPVDFLDSDALRAFAEAELEHGRAVVASDKSLELLEDATLRVSVGELFVDLSASVAHPGLPQPDGRAAIGLAVAYDAPARDALHELLGEVLDRGWSTTLDLSPRELASANEAVAAHWAEAADTEVDRRLDEVRGGQEFAAYLTSTGWDLPEIASEPGRSRGGATQTDWMREEEAPDQSLWSRDGSFPDARVLSELREQSAATGAPRALVETPTAVATIPERSQRSPRAAALPVDTPWQVDAIREMQAASRAEGATRPTLRGVDPGRAMRAQDYFEAARADFAAGSLELARTNLNLAIAYNAIDPTYRDLLIQL